MQRRLRCQHRSNWGQRFSLIQRVYRDIFRWHERIRSNSERLYDSNALSMRNSV